MQGWCILQGATILLCTSNPLFSQSVRFSSLSFRSRYTMARFSFYYPNIMRPPKSILILNLFQFHQTVLLLVNANLYFTQKSLICRLNGWPDLGIRLFAPFLNDLTDIS